VVFFHAHPDDEALLTGGTMAKLSAQGHRVVLVTATAGELGLAGAQFTASGDLAAVRLAELEMSASALGCARTVLLGYRDSGSSPVLGAPAGPGFADIDVEEAAIRLAEVLRQEAADVLTIYDPAGGYGHPDHVQVNRVGSRAAELAGTAVVLEATIDRDLLRRALSLGKWFAPRTSDFAATRFDTLYTPRNRITHRVNVSRFLGQKRASMLAHQSQTSDDGGSERGLAWMLRTPQPLFRLLFSREWFVEHGRQVSSPPLDDVLATLHETTHR